ncbi:winged helix DNA-binding domain-containing protein [Cellulosimicrobium sp. SH8]|uniref:winged helix DNA-binding domain-containing protein n=1 Tax=Cellulosimicrobium sp. SH8 TaxID=2952936 RepID=UPI0021F251E2|nr:winged helix DNA-binding domain-containing protein [Cellulosimicrobium sp. SH8]
MADGRYGPRLSHDDLSRALLARQHLDAPREASVLDEVRHLVGLQSQVPSSPYPALWSRLAAFAPDDLGSLLTDREIVRVGALRGTVHLVAADDALGLTALVRPTLAAYLRAKNQHGAALADVDLDALEEVARDLLDEPLTSVELGRRLAERWPDVDPKHLAYGARCLLPLVQVPPRGLWGANGPGTTTTWTTAQAWLGRSDPVHDAVAHDTDPAAVLAARVGLVRRYLAAFGPASVADAQRWAGLTRLKAAFDVLRPELVTFTGPDDKELLDLPDAPRPPGDVPVPVVLAGDFDNLVLSHDDRTRVLGDVPVKSVVSVNGQVAATVLVDGRVAGAWTARPTTPSAPSRATTGATPPDEAADDVVHVEVRPLRGPAGDAAGRGTGARGLGDTDVRRSPADRLREPGVRDAVVARAEDWVRCAWPGARASVVVHD